MFRCKSRRNPSAIVAATVPPPGHTGPPFTFASFFIDRICRSKSDWQTHISQQRCLSFQFPNQHGAESFLGHDWTCHVRSSLGAALRHYIVAIYIELRAVLELISMKLISQGLICWALQKCDVPTVLCVGPWNADSPDRTVYDDASCHGHISALLVPGSACGAYQPGTLWPTHSKDAAAVWRTKEGAHSKP
jgi:hypothetical protein